MSGVLMAPLKDCPVFPHDGGVVNGEAVPAEDVWDNPSTEFPVSDPK